MSCALVDNTSSANTTAGLPVASFFTSGFTAGGQFRLTADNNGADKTQVYFPVAAGTDDVIAYILIGTPDLGNLWDGDNPHSSAVNTGDGTYHSAYLRFRGTNTVELFIDGVLGATGTVGVGNVLPGDMRFGNRVVSGGNSRWFQGEMADLKAWSVNLTDAQMLAEHQHAAPQVVSNLIGWWPMTAAASAGTDASGNGHNLTINGSGFTDGTQNPTYPAGTTHGQIKLGRARRGLTYR